MIAMQETILYHRRAMSLDVAPAVRGLQAAMNAIARTELQRFRSKLRTLTPDQQQAVQLLLRGIANRFLHPAIRSLEQAAQQGDSEKIARICQLFGVAPLPLMRVREHESSTFALVQPDLTIT